MQPVLHDLACINPLWDAPGQFCGIPRRSKLSTQITFMRMPSLNSHYSQLSPPPPPGDRKWIGRDDDVPDVQMLSAAENNNYKYILIFCFTMMIILYKAHGLLKVEG